MKALVVTALAVVFVACGPTQTQQGCQRFAEIVDDVALSLAQPQRVLDLVTVETLESSIRNPHFTVTSTNAGVAIIALEYMARYHFHDDPEFSAHAYKLWKSSAVVAHSGMGSLDYIDAGISAGKIADLCNQRGYPVPKSEPNVIREYFTLVAIHRQQFEEQMRNQ